MKPPIDYIHNNTKVHRGRSFHDSIVQKIRFQVFFCHNFLFDYIIFCRRRRWLLLYSIQSDTTAAGPSLPHDIGLPVTHTKGMDRVGTSVLWQVCKIFHNIKAQEELSLGVFYLVVLYVYVETTLFLWQNHNSSTFVPTPDWFIAQLHKHPLSCLINNNNLCFFFQWRTVLSLLNNTLNVRIIFATRCLCSTVLLLQMLIDDGSSLQSC